MPRYIDAEKIKDDMRRYWIWDARLLSMLDEIDHVPTEDVRKNAHGKWKDTPNWLRKICSECGSDYVMADPLNYCPYCGARMDGDENV